MLGLRFCARVFSSCGDWGPLFIAVRGPLTIAATPAAEHRLQTRRLSSCGSRAQLLRGMWCLPRPGLEPASPALAGRFLTTAPPGKPLSIWFWSHKDVTVQSWMNNAKSLQLTNLMNSLVSLITLWRWSPLTLNKALWIYVPSLSPVKNLWITFQAVVTTVSL